MSEEQQPIKLNLGAGADIREGFCNIDIQELPGINKVLDIRTLDIFPDNSVDFIVAQHLIEYLPRCDLVNTLVEWKRVLKPGKPLEIRSTDLSRVTYAMYDTQMGEGKVVTQEMLIALLYGKQRNEFDIKYNGFTVPYLEGILYTCGYIEDNCVKENLDFILTSLKPRDPNEEDNLDD